MIRFVIQVIVVILVLNVNLLTYSVVLVKYVKADTLRDAQCNFERLISSLSKVTGGIRRDLPVEIDKYAISNAITSWGNGRVALNDFFTKFLFLLVSNFFFYFLDVSMANSFIYSMSQRLVREKIVA
jgi:hypothetical protein